MWWPEAHGPGAWREVRREVCGDPPWPPLARAEPEEERIVSAVAEGAGISFIMLERSRSLRIPGAVYRRFAPPEPTMGIAIAWRRGDNLPTVHRLRRARGRRGDATPPRLSPEPAASETLDRRSPVSAVASSPDAPPGSGAGLRALRLVVVGGVLGVPAALLAAAFLAIVHELEHWLWSEWRSSVARSVWMTRHSVGGTGGKGR